MNVDIDVEVVEGAIQSDYWCVSLLLNGKYSSLTHCERYLIFPFFSDYLSKNAIDLENSFFFFYSKWIVLIEMSGGEGGGASVPIATPLPFPTSSLVELLNKRSPKQCHMFDNGSALFLFWEILTSNQTFAVYVKLLYSDVNCENNKLATDLFG